MVNSWLAAILKKDSYRNKASICGLETKNKLQVSLNSFGAEDSSCGEGVCKMVWRTEWLVKCIFSFSPEDLKRPLSHNFLCIWWTLSSALLPKVSSASPGFSSSTYFSRTTTNNNSISVAFPHKDQFPSSVIIFIDHQKSPLVYELILEARLSQGWSMLTHVNLTCIKKYSLLRTQSLGGPLTWALVLRS